MLATIGECVYTTAPVSAAISASQTSICAGQTIQFSSTSTGNPTAYSWSFPGGTPATSTSQSVAVSYAAKPTVFMEQAMQAGCADSSDGLGMLVGQAAHAYALWHGVMPQTAPVYKDLRAAIDGQ